MCGVGSDITVCGLNWIALVQFEVLQRLYGRDDRMECVPVHGTAGDGELDDGREGAKYVDQGLDAFVEHSWVRGV